MAQHNKTGREGEKLASDYLRSKGYEILHTNWHSGHYELDIVATDGEELIIAEVKTRTSEQFAPPEQAVDLRKMRRLVYAADHYVKSFRVELPVRFDIIGILLIDNRIRIDHIPDAFYPPVL